MKRVIGIISLLLLSACGNNLSLSQTRLDGSRLSSVATNEGVAMDVVAYVKIGDSVYCPRTFRMDGNETRNISWRCENLPNGQFQFTLVLEPLSNASQAVKGIARTL